MSEPRIIEMLEPHEVEARIKTREDILAAREIMRLAALPIEDYEPLPESISTDPSEPRIIKSLEPHEVEARIKAREDILAAREVLRLAALPVKEYDPLPGPEGIPTVWDSEQRKYVPYLSLFPIYPEHEWGPGEEPLVLEAGDPRAAIQSPYKMSVPVGDAELPPGYPGRVTPSPAGQYAVSSSGPLVVTRISERGTL